MEGMIGDTNVHYPKTTSGYSKVGLVKKGQIRYVWNGDRTQKNSCFRLN